MKTLLTLILGLALFHTSPLLAQGAEQPAQQDSDSPVTTKVKQPVDNDC